MCKPDFVQQNKYPVSHPLKTLMWVCYLKNSTGPDLKEEEREKGKEKEHLDSWAITPDTEHESHIWAKMTYGMDRCLT